jgi:hypothetical protein
MTVPEGHVVVVGDDGVGVRAGRSAFEGAVGAGMPS